jgi:hypothetical protein
MSELLGMAASLIGALAGSGPWGIGALVLVGSVLGWGIIEALKEFNRSVDRRDLKNAASDSGTTSTDLTNQARDVSQGLDALRKSDPPEGAKDDLDVNVRQNSPRDQ